MENLKEILTVQEVSQIIAKTPQYVRKLIISGQIKGVLLGRQWLVERSELNSYIMRKSCWKEPRDHEYMGKSESNIIALSFFSGAMGLDLGLEQEGIPVRLLCESNKYCRMTISRNRPQIALIGDIHNFSSEDILKFAKVPSGRKVDLIVGGPPCQAFSTAGLRKSFADSRGNLILTYIDIIQDIRPTYIVLENVRGLLSAEALCANLTHPIKGGALWIILERLRKLGYQVSFELYNAANFGAPQIRERLVIIGKLGGGKVPHLAPTHSEGGKYSLHPWIPLKAVLAKMHNKKQHYIEFPEKRLKFYRLLKEGQYWKDLPPHLQYEAMGEKLKLGGGKTGFFRRLSCDKPSPTLVTNPTMPATDLCHPYENRPLSVEEYKEIQGFPPDWEICGSILECYRQIGNAVPVSLGRAIARTILADMRGQELPQIEGFRYSRYNHTDEDSWEQEMKQRIKKSLAIGQ